MADDIQDIETWLDQFKHPKALIGRIAKRFLLHRADIEQDFDTMEDDWKNQMYLQSGEAMADLIVSAIGPVEATDDDGAQVAAPVERPIGEHKQRLAEHHGAE